MFSFCPGKIKKACLSDLRFDRGTIGYIIEDLEDNHEFFMPKHLVEKIYKNLDELMVDML